MEDDDGYYEMEDSEGFYGYVPRTVDPGPTLIMSTVVFCILMTILLPILLCLGEIYDKRNQPEDKVPGEEEKDSEEEAISPPSIIDQNSISGKSLSSSVEDSSLTPPSQFQSTVSTILSTLSVRGKTGGNRKWMTGRQRAAKRLQYFLSEDKEETDVGKTRHSCTLNVGSDSVDVTPESRSTQEQEDFSQFENDKPLDSSDGSESSDCTESSSTIEVMKEQKYSFIDTVLETAKFDHEMKRLFQLGIPFATQALITAILEVASIGVVGHLLGTKELAAAYCVEICLGFTADILGGFIESLTTLCSQAIGAENYKLAGHYVQLSMVLYIVLSIPFVIFWVFFIGPTILWLGFDEETAEIGKDYAYVLIIDYFLISGIWESLHALLDVMGREKYSMILAIAEDLVSLIAMFVAATFSDVTLRDFALIDVGIGLAFLVFNISFITWRGWFEDYFPGLLGSCALYNTKALKAMSKLSASLSFGLLLSDGEWEIMTLFARYLGPAEVVSWGIIGSLWGSAEDIISSIGDAAEVRCAFLLGAGNPQQAKLSAYKSILIGMFIATFIVSIIFILAEDIPRWITNDPTLQDMTAELLPLFGIGSISLTMGSISWTLIGSQGRYGLATLVVFLASILISIPGAYIFSIVLNVNLQGQMAAVVAGYMVSGTVNAFFLFRTDWETISRKVVELNAETYSCMSSSSDSDSDSDSSSVSSSSSSSSSSNSSASTNNKSASLENDVISTGPSSSLTSESPKEEELLPEKEDGTLPLHNDLELKRTSSGESSYSDEEVFNDSYIYSGEFLHGSF